MGLFTSPKPRQETRSLVIYCSWFCSFKVILNYEISITEYYKSVLVFNCCRDNGWHIFSGNELGALLGWWSWYCFHQANPDEDPSQLHMMASTVSSKFLKTMADAEGFSFTVFNFIIINCIVHSTAMISSHTKDTFLLMLWQ